jgi:hypothetical protein
LAWNIRSAPEIKSGRTMTPAETNRHPGKSSITMKMLPAKKVKFMSQKENVLQKDKPEIKKVIALSAAKELKRIAKRETAMAVTVRPSSKIMTENTIVKVEKTKYIEALFPIKDARVTTIPTRANAMITVATDSSVLYP